MAVKPDEYYDDLETMTPVARQQYQHEKLAAKAAHDYAHAPAIRKLLDGAGVRPEDIRTAKDLEKLPVTRKTDLIDQQKADPPYGGYLAIPPEEVERVFLSPGPVYEPIQHSGIPWFAKAFWAAGFRKGDVAVNTFTYHLSPAGILFHEALRDCGATAVPTGTGNTEIQIQAMHDLRVTGFIGTPTFLITVIKKAEEMGYNFRKDFCLKKAWFTGEMLPPSLRRIFREEYHIGTTQGYAVTEPGGAIAYECSEQQGMHLMDEYLLEIIDPETGRQLPAGEVGEIVVTPLHNMHWGLLRFGTGDMSALTTAACPCGRTAPRLTGIVGRAGDAVKVRGMFIVARQAETALAETPGVERFQLVVGRREHRDELVLMVEAAAGAAQEKLAPALQAAFQDACRVKIDRIDFVAAGTVPEERPTIKDTRRWD